MSQTPNISLIAVGRNDDYGGDFRSRLQQWATWSVHQLSQAKVPSEVIFVNYNPLDVEPIKSFIKWPDSTDWVKVKLITVPNEEHQKIVREHGVKDVPVLEYHAKNIGVRRAKGEFILCMNPDILIPAKVIRSFSNLYETCYYRSNRLDYSAEIQIDVSKTLNEQLSGSVKAVWLKGNYVLLDGFSTPSYYRKLLTNKLSNLWKLSTLHLRPILDFCSIPVYYNRLQYKYHSNASGDFLLMSRQNWFKLKGYKEASQIALHTDSLMVIQAAFLGLKEHTYLSPIYHKQHERRYDAVNKEDLDQDEAYALYNREIQGMNKTGMVKIYNGDSWGRSGSSFEEYLY